MRSKESFTRSARRAQIIRATIDTVAEHGYERASLARIAASIGISKGSILYHFSDRTELFQETLSTVFKDIATTVIEHMSSAESARDALHRYTTGLVGYMDAHRDEVRLIIESSTDPMVNDEMSSESRWDDLIKLIDQALNESDWPAGTRPNSEVLAVSLNGAIDALTGRAVHDLEFDLTAAGEELARLTDHITAPPAG